MIKYEEEEKLLTYSFAFLCWNYLNFGFDFCPFKSQIGFGFGKCKLIHSCEEEKTVSLFVCV